MPGIHVKDVPRTVAEFLENDRHVALRIRPEPEPDALEFRIEWELLDYDAETETWEPVQRSRQRRSLLQRVAYGAGRIFTWVKTVLARIMPTFDVDRQEINVFEVNGTYVFKHYFEQDEVFGQLRQYYNDDVYRFEISSDDELDVVADTLAAYFYDLNIVEDKAAFCVVTEKYADHGDILKNAAIKFERGNRNIFLMKDQLSVDQAIEQGAQPLEEADVEVQIE